MLGWLFRSNYQGPPRPEHRTNLPNSGGKGGQAPKFPIIRDHEGVDTDSTWEYVNQGVEEGWLVHKHEHIMTTRNNEIAFGFIYYLSPPKE